MQVILWPVRDNEKNSRLFDLTHHQIEKLDSMIVLRARRGETLLAVSNWRQIILRILIGREPAS